MVEILQNFVAFSEYMNFNNNDISHNNLQTDFLSFLKMMYFDLTNALRLPTCIHA